MLPPAALCALRALVAALHLLPAHCRCCIQCSCTMLGSPAPSLQHAAWPHCSRAAPVLLPQMPSGAALHEELKAATGQKTVP